MAAMNAGESSSVVVPQQDETFQDFMESWTLQLKSDLRDLVSATSNPSADEQAEVVKVAMKHYEDYFEGKSSWADRDVILIFSTTCASPLELAFTWIGGWIPALAVYLVSSLSGVQIGDLAHELNTIDTLGLNHGQLGRVEELRQMVMEEERVITEEMNQLQNEPLLELAMRLKETDSNELVKAAIGDLKEGYKEVLKKADELRMTALIGVVDILNPSQALRLLIAAAQIQLGLYGWGRQIEAHRAGGNPAA